MLSFDPGTEAEPVVPRLWIGAEGPNGPNHVDRAALGRNLTAGVVDVIGTAITGGRFEGVNFPSEARLAKHFVVSHSVIREAIKMLTAKGLLTARPRQGIIVRPQDAWSLFDPDVLGWLLKHRPSARLLQQLTELRLGIEPAAAALAARSPSQDRRFSVQSVIRRLARADGPEEVLAGRIAFHAAVLSASENPFYGRFRDLVSAVLRTESRFIAAPAVDTLDISAYQMIAKAICAGEEKASYATMRDLLTA